VWNESVSLKVISLAWRVLQNKILTKDNLIKRGILKEKQNQCSSGCGNAEKLLVYFLNVR